MKIKFILSLILASLFSGYAFAEEVKFESKLITVGRKKISVEIADTEVKSARGLMFRRQLAQDSGMLFIFQDEEVRSFWMKNTFVDLDIGFFSANKTLVDIQTMMAVKSEMEMSPPSYVSQKPAMYALEMNAGWFKKNKIRVGSKLRLK